MPSSRSSRTSPAGAPSMPELPDTAYFSLAPDWVCEVLSRSTERIDRDQKLPYYAHHRVRHVWLLDPIQRTLEVLLLDGTRWVVAENHGGHEVARAAPFAAMGIELARLWID